MLLSLVPATALAAEGDANVTNGNYTADGVWSAGGNGTVSYSAKDGTQLELSKTAEDKGDNTFEITLQVKATSTATITPPGAAATVLVIDVSGSMAWCANCGAKQGSNHAYNCDRNTRTSRMAAAKTAAINFLDSYKGDIAGSGRYVSIVKFSTLSSVAQDWVDVSTTAGYNAAVSAINGLSANGGTNLEQGLSTANTQMAKDDVKNVAKDKKNVVVLTDGAPTYYGINKSGTKPAGGDGDEGSYTINSKTAATAGTLRGSAKVYTVCFGVAKDSTYSGGPTVGNFLRDSIATNETGKTYAYNANNAEELYEAFKEISSTVIHGLDGSGATVTDPMGELIDPQDPPHGIEIVSGSFVWTLPSDVKPETSTKTVDGKTVTTYTYTYTTQYTVKLDVDAEGFKEGEWYPANNVTTLHWNDTEGFDFPVPGVKGMAPRYTVTYNKGNNGTLDGQDASGNVIHTDIKKWTATPAAPAVTADDDYYFTDWDKTIADKVTEDVTYTAKYAPETAVTITGDSKTEKYNGSEQSVTTYTVSGVDASAVSGISYAANGTDVGSYDGAFTGTPVITIDGKDVTEQYKITYKPGALNVTKRDVTLTSGTESWPYDGNAHSNTAVTVTGDSFATGEGATYSNFASITDVGSVDNTFDYTLKEGTKADNYNISTVNGKLTVTQNTATIKVTADSAEKVYDGTALTKNTYKVEGTLVEGDALTAVVEGSITDAGTVDNVVKSYKVMRGNVDVTANYANIVTENGTLTVTKRDVTLTSATASKTYDGTPLTNDKVTAEGFVRGEGATYNVTGSQTNVGTSDNDFTYTLNNNTKADNYNITVVKGTLTVTKITDKLTVTAKSDSKMYDGSALTKDGYTYDGKLGLLDELVVVVTGSQTDVGESANVVTSVKVMRGNVDVTANYADIAKVDGKLTVTPRTVVLTSATDSWTYDGKAHSNTTVTVSVDGFAEGEGATYSNFASITNVGEQANTFDYTLNNNTKADNYNITVVKGKLTVTAMGGVVVTVKENSGEFTYDGTEKTVEGYVVKNISNPLYTAADFSFNGSAVVKGTNAGTYDMEVASADFTNNNSNFKDVTFVVEDGQLVITPVEGVVVTVKENSGEYTYDGTEKTVEGYDVKNISDPLYTVDDFTFNGNAVVKGTNAGTYDMEVVPADFANNNHNFKNVTFVVEDGQLVIYPIEGVVVTITENSGEFTYDGTEKTVTGYTVSISNPLYTVADFSFKGDATIKGTNVGTYDMDLKASDFANINDNFENVTFEIVDGQMIINPITNTLTVTADSDHKMYDGTALTDDGYTFTEGVLASGDVLTAVVEGTITNVGTEANVVKSVTIKNAADDDVTANYTGIKTVDGKLEVTKRAVTMTSATDSKTYDGTPLTNDTVTVTGDGFAEGEGATYDVTGSQTNVGSSKNTFTYALNEGTLADNYEIKTEEGTLTVAKKGSVVVTITENSGEFTYDGTEKSVTGYTVSISDPLYTEADFSFKGDAAIKGTYVGTYDMDLKASDFTNANDNFENVTFVIVDGQMTIKPVEATITITANSDEKVYDGTALTNDGYTFTEDILVEGDELTAVVEGTITDAGEEANVVTSYKVMRGDVDVTDCYTFAESVDGKLVVTPKEVTITSGSATKVYDGKALTNDEVTAEGFVEGEGATYTVTGSQTNAGFSENTFEYVLDRNTKAENYTVKTVFGKLEVTKRDVTITSDSATKVYDGKALTNDKVVADGFVKGEGASYTVTGSQTDVGSSKNTFSYTLNEGTLADNYNINVVEGTLTVTQAPHHDDTPQTGDHSINALWMTLMALSAGGLGVMVVAGKKKRENAE